MGAMLRPPPQLTVSQWAERHRILGSRASSEPGPWRTSRTPYLREVMDALSAVHPARRVVFMKGAQVGATESGNCWLGYILHHVPAPALAVQPTVELAKRFSRQRIDPLLEETPALKERVAPARARDSGNTLLSKEFPGGILVLTGANSAVGLRSMTARFLFLDEIDAYPGDVEGEGDPIALAEARARTFGWRRKAFLVSTPTIAGRSRIEREYAASDQRRYFVPCPHCGEMQWLKFERLRWEKGDPRSPVAGHGGGAGSAHGRLPHLGALLAGRLAVLGADRPRLGGGAGQAGGPEDLQEHRARRDLAGAGRGAGLGTPRRAA
jgi:phage terminase large subunit GpA-like protein